MRELKTVGRDYLSMNMKYEKAKRLGVKPKAVIVDAGYGGEENCVCLENKRTAA
jgi:hypothetical protein